MGGGRATGHKYFLRNWHDYYKYTSEVGQIGEAIEGIDSVFVELVQNAIEPAILKQTFKSGSGLSREEERFIFYAGFGLDYIVPYSSASSEKKTQQLGNLRIDPPFRKPSVYHLCYYLICTALKQGGMTLKQFENVDVVKGKKSEKMSASGNYSKYKDAIEMAFKGGSGKPYDQVYGNSGKTAANTAAKIKTPMNFRLPT